MHMYTYIYTTYSTIFIRKKCIARIYLTMRISRKRAKYTRKEESKKVVPSFRKTLNFLLVFIFYLSCLPFLFEVLEINSFHVQ